MWYSDKQSQVVEFCLHTMRLHRPQADCLEMGTAPVLCSFFFFVRCRVVVDNVGDHVMPEQSVCFRPDELGWAYVILQTCTQTVQILVSLSFSCSSVSLLLFQLPLVPLCLAFSWHVQRNQAAFAWSSSLMYVEILQLSELPYYSFSPSTKFSASCSKTTCPLPSASLSLFLRLSKFHIHMTRLTIHNSITHVTLSLIWFSDSMLITQRI